ncbi:hypothetical protein [Herpetosiphon giganteus]|uniref:hypothetical protein n=1 Tax=Herpetosiphon giganteus TaxID=2029754 RepID=UPI00195D1F3B|nr:hypothetical protein [Herpetosiphon giganteus]MBM7842872.1 hypothetical protein [Herpetosiphon giganteus]
MSNQPPYGQQPQQGGYPPQQGGYPPQQPVYPPQQPGYPPQQPYGYPPQPQKRGGCLKFGIIGVIVALLLCIGISFVAYRLIAGEVDDVKATLDGFMKAGAANDINAAKAFVDTSIVSDEQLAGLLSQRELFEGYTSVSDDFAAPAANAGTDQTTTLGIAGTLNYSDGTGTYDVQFNRLESGWKIRYINIKR